MNKHKAKIMLTSVCVCALSVAMLAISTPAIDKSASQAIPLDSASSMQYVDSNINQSKQDYVFETIDNLEEIADTDIKQLYAVADTSTDVVNDNNQTKFMTEKGQSVFSPVDGIITEVVSYAEKDRENLVATKGFGSIIIIEDENSNRYLLSHLHDVLCEKGDTVKVGDIVGTTGTTGNTKDACVGLSVYKPI
ncbi:MAG: M23 family metallopeptidase [Oscillospiraceae bacterium]